MAQHFTRGPTGVRQRLNELVDEKDKFSRIVGDGIVQVQRSSLGTTISLNRDRLAALIPKIGLKSEKLKIFEVQSDATGDAIYNCYEESIVSIVWTNTKGAKKTTEKSTDSYEVLNLAEFDPEGVYVRHLAAGDLIFAGHYIDNLGTARWAGVPFRLGSADRARMAYVTSAPGAVATVTCELDYKDSGTSITVYCNIAQGGTALNAAVPRLAADDPILIQKCRYYDGTDTRDRWVCTTVFMPSEDCECT